MSTPNPDRSLYRLGDDVPRSTLLNGGHGDSAAPGHAFAALAGVAPIPASSGQIQRMRLNRGGNRQLNRALYVIAVTRSRFHPPAKTYVTRRMEADGKSWREAIRALKRLLVRPVFRLLVQGSIVPAEAA